MANTAGHLRKTFVIIWLNLLVIMVSFPRQPKTISIINKFLYLDGFSVCYFICWGGSLISLFLLFSLLYAQEKENSLYPKKASITDILISASRTMTTANWIRMTLALSARICGQRTLEASAARQACVAGTDRVEMSSPGCGSILFKDSPPPPLSSFCFLFCFEGARLSGQHFRARRSVTAGYSYRSALSKRGNRKVKTFCHKRMETRQSKT